MYVARAAQNMVLLQVGFTKAWNHRRNSLWVLSTSALRGDMTTWKPLGYRCLKIQLQIRFGKRANGIYPKLTEKLSILKTKQTVTSMSSSLSCRSSFLTYHYVSAVSGEDIYTYIYIYMVPGSISRTLI